MAAIILPQPRAPWLDRLRTISLGIGARGAVGVGLARQRGGAVASPHALNFDGINDYVDCGNSASIMSLNLGAMTVDAYAYIPASGNFGPWSRYTLVSQGNARETAGLGWSIYWMGGSTGLDGYFSFGWGCGTGSHVVNDALGAKTRDTWYYIRARLNWTENPPHSTGRIWVNTVSSLVSVAWWKPAGRTSTANARHGAASSGYYWPGRLCYAHIWNADIGDLVSVPTSPQAVDGNTVGRWLYSDGIGLQLTDSSGNNSHGLISGASWSSSPAGWVL